MYCVLFTCKMRTIHLPFTPWHAWDINCLSFFFFCLILLHVRVWRQYLSNRKIKIQWHRSNSVNFGDQIPWEMNLTFIEIALQINIISIPNWMRRMYSCIDFCGACYFCVCFFDVKLLLDNFFRDELLLVILLNTKYTFYCFFSPIVFEKNFAHKRSTRRMYCRAGGVCLNPFYINLLYCFCAERNLISGNAHVLSHVAAVRIEWRTVSALLTQFKIHLQLRTSCKRMKEKKKNFFFFSVSHHGLSARN